MLLSLHKYNKTDTGYYRSVAPSLHSEAEAAHSAHTTSTLRAAAGVSTTSTTSLSRAIAAAAAATAAAAAVPTAAPPRTGADAGLGLQRLGAAVVLGAAPVGGELE